MTVRRRGSKEGTREEAPKRRHSEDEEVAKPVSRRGKKSEDDDDDDDSRSGRATSGRGWGGVARKAKQNEEEKKNRVNEFWLKDGESAIVQLLDAEPFCVEGHTIQKKGTFKFVPCQLNSQKHCLMCEDGAGNTWRAIFKLLDYRGSWDTKKNRFKHDEPIEKVWLLGNKLAEQLNRFLSKKGKEADEVVLEITRSGEGTSATYNIEIAWDDDNDKPMKPKKYDSKLSPLEEIYAPPTDTYVEDHYL